MKSLVAHYRNKYPGGRVLASEAGLDVYCEAGEHRVSMRKNGADMLVCVSEEYGCVDRHDLAPIPDEAKVYSHREGKICCDAKKLDGHKKHASAGKVMSIDEASKVSEEKSEE